MSELTYENKNGDTVYTSAYLKNRGTCCKTCCLHCPYGHTLKIDGLIFEDVSDSRIEEAQLIIDGGVKKEEFSIGASMLAGAFGGPKKVDPITSKNIGNYKFILLKNQVCGLIRKNTNQVKEVFLLEHFKNQDLTIEMIGSYL